MKIVGRTLAVISPSPSFSWRRLDSIRVLAAERFCDTIRAYFPLGQHPQPMHLDFGPLVRPWHRHFPFALEALVFGGGGPAASLVSRSAFRRSRLLENAFCAISCSVIAFLASTWRNALRASRSALVGGFVISSP